MSGARITAEEFLEFVAIVERETTPQGRRMIDNWAGPADADSPTLIATFALLWRSELQVS